VSAPAVVEFRDVTRTYGGLRPLRLRSFTATPRDRVVLSGFDQAAAEAFVHLISGALVPDEGSVIVAGVDTRQIGTDTEWLASLDRFGIVTHRAVLIEGMSIASNLALPMTLAVEPMSPVTRAAVERLAGDVGLPRERLDAPASTLTTIERLRVHVARAVAQTPTMLLLEHPTATLGSDVERSEAGRVVRAAADAHSLGWIAISEDDVFAKVAGGERLRLTAATGELRRTGGWWPRW
jgi:ABC-type ATPase involved in cell division